MDRLSPKNRDHDGSSAEGANRDVGYITFFPDGKDATRQPKAKASKSHKKEALSPAANIASPPVSQVVIMTPPETEAKNFAIANQKIKAEQPSTAGTNFTSDCPTTAGTKRRPNPMGQKAVRVTTNRKSCRFRPVGKVQSIDMSAAGGPLPNGYETRANNEVEESKGSQLELASMGSFRLGNAESRHGSTNVSMLQPHRVGSSDANGSFALQPPYQKIPM